jgi:hypothetical protein
LKRSSFGIIIASSSQYYSIGKAVAPLRSVPALIF